MVKLTKNNENLKEQTISVTTSIKHKA